MSTVTLNCYKCNKEFEEDEYEIELSRCDSEAYERGDSFDHYCECPFCDEELELRIKINDVFVDFDFRQVKE